MCPPSWTYLQDYTGMHGQQNIKSLWQSTLGVSVEMILLTNISMTAFARFWEGMTATTGFRLSAAEGTSVRHHAQRRSGADPAHYPIKMERLPQRVQKAAPGCYHSPPRKLIYMAHTLIYMAQIIMMYQTTTLKLNNKPPYKHRVQEYVELYLH